MLSRTVSSQPLLRWAETRCICRAFSSLNNTLRAEGAAPPPATTAPTSAKAQQLPVRDAGGYQLSTYQSKHKGKYEMARSFLDRTQSVRDQVTTERKTRASMEALQKDGQARDLEKFQIRKWKQGDVYAPHDLTPAEMHKWKVRSRPTMDAFDALAINPLNEYKNFSIMSEYMTSMGRIRHSKDTGLRRVNQRRVAKAIRRAIGIGLMPSIHKHPEMLEMEARSRRSKVSRF